MAQAPVTSLNSGRPVCDSRQLKITRRKKTPALNMTTASFKPPNLTLSSLPYPQVQGSAQISHTGYTVLASANGPIDPPTRAQQHPEECTLEVNMRESTGGGGPRERNIERVLQRTLKPLLDVRAHPRTIVQITLQVLRTSRDNRTTAPIGQWESAVDVLPVLVNVSVAAMLDANIAMKGFAVAVGVVAPSVSYDDDDNDDDERMEDDVGAQIIDDEKHLEDARAGATIHAFAFTGKGDMLLAISEGACSSDTWKDAAELAKATCCGSSKCDEGMIGWLRREIGAEITRKRRWRQDKEEG